MKIERFFYGMVNGKIILLKTKRVNEILSDENFQFLRRLTPNDNKQWWLPAEQIITLSHIEEINDGDGRAWVQNQTLLIPIQDYIKLTKPHEIFCRFFEPALHELPKTFESITLTALEVKK